MGSVRVVWVSFQQGNCSVLEGAPKMSAVSTSLARIMELANHKIVGDWL